MLMTMIIPSIVMNRKTRESFKTPKDSSEGLVNGVQETSDNRSVRIAELIYSEGYLNSAPDRVLNGDG